MTQEIISRQAAKAAGLARYFTGKPCKRGHISARKVGDGSCFDCLKHRTAENAPAKALYDRRRYEKDQEGMRARSAAVKAKDRAKHRASVREWQKQNPALVAEYKKKNKAVRRSAMKDKLPEWYGELDDFVMREATDLCVLRKAATGFSWHIDHMIPLCASEACGLHVAENMQVIPASMNYRKHNKLILTTPGEWIAHL